MHLDLLELEVTKGYCLPLGTLVGKILIHNKSMFRDMQVPYIYLQDSTRYFENFYGNTLYVCSYSIVYQQDIFISAIQLKDNVMSIQGLLAHYPPALYNVNS